MKHIRKADHVSQTHLQIAAWQFIYDTIVTGQWFSCRLCCQDIAQGDPVLRGEGRISTATPSNQHHDPLSRRHLQEAVRT